MRHIMSVNVSFSKTYFAIELMCFGSAVWDNGIFLMEIQECSWRTQVYTGKSSALQTEACCLVTLCLMLAWVLLAGTRLTETISRCWAKTFFTTPKIGERRIHLSASHPTDYLSQTLRWKDQPSASSQVSSGTEACALAQEEQRLLAHGLYFWLNLKCSGILQLHRRESKPISKHELANTALSQPFQLRGCTRYYVQISVVLLLVCGFTCCSMCTAWCSLALAKITALPSEAQTMLQNIDACVRSLLAPVMACHSDCTAHSFPHDWLLFWEKIVRCVYGLAEQCQGAGLASAEFTWVLTIATCDTSLLGKLCRCLQYIHTL